MLTTEPLAVWDVREASWFGPQRPARDAWLREHGLTANGLCRVEFWLLDEPTARLFCHHRNGRPAALAVPLSELPPRELLYL